MPATTSWWFCGKCAFENHPRPNQDLSKCEQCGSSRDEPDALDFAPQPKGR